MHGTTRRREPRKNFYTFRCNCGRVWLAEIAETEMTYRWMKRVGLLNPVTIVYKSNVLSDRGRGKLSFAHRRMRQVMSKIAE